MNATFTIDTNNEGYTFILCHVCGLSSYNPSDIKYKYCGQCDFFHKHIDIRKPEETIMTAKQWIVGRWRMLFGMCPACGSEPPKIKECTVCDYRSNYNNRPRRLDMQYWWNRYVLYCNKTGIL